MKEYLEERYNINGKQRVFSAGTFTTLKLKAILKDVARVHRVPHAIVNYITAIFEDDKMDWTDLFKVAATNKKVNKFIQDYPMVIEDIRTLMGQPKASSIHASAIIVLRKQEMTKKTWNVSISFLYEKWMDYWYRSSMDMQRMKLDC